MDQELQNWNANLVYGLFPIEVARAILKIQIPVQQEPNSLMWTAFKSGRFSVKLVYRMENHERFLNSSSIPSKDWKLLWSSSLHNRHKHFMWKYLSDIHPTRMRLKKLLKLEDCTCVICGLETETLEYLFLKCPLIELLWWNSKWNIRLQAFAYWDLV